MATLIGNSRGIIVGAGAAGRCGPGTPLIPFVGDQYNRVVAVGLGTSDLGIAYQYSSATTATIGSCDGTEFHFDGLQTSNPSGYDYTAFLGPHTFTYPIDITLRYRILGPYQPTHYVFDQVEFRAVLADTFTPAATPPSYNNYVIFDTASSSSLGSPSFFRNNLQNSQTYDSGYSGSGSLFPSTYQYSSSYGPGPGQYAPTWLNDQWPNNVWRMARFRFAPTTDFDTTQVGAGVHGHGCKVWQDGTSEPTAWTTYIAWAGSGSITVATNPIQYFGWDVIGQFAAGDGPASTDVDYVQFNSGW